MKFELIIAEVPRKGSGPEGWRNHLPAQNILGTPVEISWWVENRLSCQDYFVLPCDTQGFSAPLCSLGAGIPAGATWQPGEARALLGAGTVRLSRECRKEDKVLLCGCLHRVASATTTKSSNYFNCKVWKQTWSFRLQSVFQVFTLLLICNYSGLWSPKSEDVKDFIVVFPLAPWCRLHYHGEGKWQSTADAQHPWLIWCSAG